MRLVFNHHQFGGVSSFFEWVSTANWTDYIVTTGVSVFSKLCFSDSECCRSQWLRPRWSGQGNRNKHTHLCVIISSTRKCVCVYNLCLGSLRAPHYTHQDTPETSVRVSSRLVPDISRRQQQHTRGNTLNLSMLTTLVSIVSPHTFSIRTFTFARTMSTTAPTSLSSPQIYHLDKITTVILYCPALSFSLSRSPFPFHCHLILPRWLRVCLSTESMSSDRVATQSDNTRSAHHLGD